MMKVWELIKLALEHPPAADPVSQELGMILTVKISSGS